MHYGPQRAAHYNVNTPGKIPTAGPVVRGGVWESFLLTTLRDYP